MKSNTQKFETPINQGRHLHGTLTVDFTIEGEEVDIIRVIYKRAYTSNNKADVTFLLQEHAPKLFDELEEMARDYMAKLDPSEDYTMQMQ